MPLGPTRAFDINLSDVRLVAPVRLASRWVTAVGPGGVNVADNGGSLVTNPTAQVVKSTTRILNRDKKAGTTLRLRLAYAGTPEASPSVQVFGRSGTDAWQLLPSKGVVGADATYLVANPAIDVTDGTFKYTAVDPATCSWDCEACDEILVAIVTPCTVSAGSAASAFIQGKIV